MRKVTLENIRNIKKLAFEIPRPGVWMLASANGAGKTSLLACLVRIGKSNAFQTSFPRGYGNIDQNKNAKISYEMNNEKIVYSYGGQRWAPTPRTAKVLKEKMGYRAVEFFGANAERITPTADDLKAGKPKAAQPELIASLNQIFSTSRFEQLRVLSFKGKAQKAFLLRKSPNSQFYHSEKNFSLGELCVLKLINRLLSIQENSLVLIDELEMALHPIAQRNLYTYLKEMAKQKKLTVIFSTHSVTLIKTTSDKNIIFLEPQDDGEVKILTPCTASYALRNISLYEENLPEKVFYVEDEAAKYILDILIEKVLLEKYQARVKPSFSVVYIGGFPQVVNMVRQHGRLFPAHVVAHAILDLDAKIPFQRSILPEIPRAENIEKAVDFFPWSPELGLCLFFRDNLDSSKRKLAELAGQTRIHLNNVSFNDLTGADCAEDRNKAKNIVSKITDEIATHSSLNSHTACRVVFTAFAQLYFEYHKNEVMNLLGPKL